MLKIKSAASRAALLVLCVVFLLLPTVRAPEVADALITVELNRDEADTWASVLVQVRVAPFVDEDNRTYHFDRNITIVLTDLDTPEELVRENILLGSGIAVYGFRVMPDWGECLLAVDVLDPLTGAEVRQTVKVYYSNEYLMYLMALQAGKDIKVIKEDSAASDARNERTALTMAVMLFLVLPVALLRLDHKSARRDGKSSMWDKAQDRFFNWTPVHPALWHYLEDDAYEFRASGRRFHKEVIYSRALVAARVDMAALGKVEEMLEKELGKYEEPAPAEEETTELAAEVEVEAEAEAAAEEPVIEEEFQRLEDEGVEDIEDELG